MFLVLALVLALTLAGTVVPPAIGSPDGRYSGRYVDVDDPGDEGGVTFRVKGAGRWLYAFEASPLAVCVNPDAIGGIEVVSRDFLIGKVRVRSDGRFNKQRTISLGGDSQQVFRISGRILNGKVRNGRMTMEKHCSSVERFTAHR
ncbi:MAG TPA: hypothetical protein VG898_02400 [Solirubrobacterales bacterium]|nr:hypothetical protein [Solirubrobacterales bacterium]